MTPEKEPQNLEALQNQAQKLGGLLERARSLSREPGGPSWPERFQLTTFPPSKEYLKHSLHLGQITKGIISKGIPSLTERKMNVELEIAKEQKASEPELDLIRIGALVSRGFLPPEALTKAQEIVSKLNHKDEPISPKPPRKEKQYQKLSLPNKEEVIAHGKTNRKVLSSLIVAYNQGLRGVNYKVLIDYCTLPKLTLEQAKTKLKNVLYVLRTKNLKDSSWDIETFVVEPGETLVTLAHKKTSDATLTAENAPSGMRKRSQMPPMENMTLTDGTTTIRLNRRLKGLLQRTIDRGPNGTTKAMEQNKDNLRDDFAKINAALGPTDFEAANITPVHDNNKGIGGRWVYRERPKEEPTALSENNKDVIAPPEKNYAPALTEGGQTTIFVAAVTASSQGPELEVLKDEELEEDEGDPTLNSQKVEEVTKIRQATRLQVALNIFKAVNNKTLQTLDRDPTTYIQGFIPPDQTYPDAKTLILESITLGLSYWNRNEWDIPSNASTEEKELQAVCFDLSHSKQVRNTPEKAKQEILTYFNLP